MFRVIAVLARQVQGIRHGIQVQMSYLSIRTYGRPCWTSPDETGSIGSVSTKKPN